MPSGMSEIVTERVSEPSVSVKAEDRSSEIAVSSSPDTSVAVNVGASASPVTPTSIVADDVEIAPEDSSTLVVVTVNEKSSLESSGGVIVNPSSWSCVTSAEPSVIVISLPLASSNMAPSGISEIVMVRSSDPSTSSCVTSISSAMAVSSVPATSAVSIVAPSAVVSVAVPVEEIV